MRNRIYRRRNIPIRSHDFNFLVKENERRQRHEGMTSIVLAKWKNDLASRGLLCCCWLSVTMIIITSAAATPRGYAGTYYTINSGACEQKNPFAAFQCACPMGTRPSLPIEMKMWGRSALVWCMEEEPTEVFGGAFQTTTDGTCLVPNQYTSACTCPSSRTPTNMLSRGGGRGGYAHVWIEAMGVTDGGTSENRTNVTLCVGYGESSKGFGGVYTLRQNSEFEDSVCVSGNPLLDTNGSSSSCSCPAGYKNHRFMFTEYPDGGFGKGHLCYADCEILQREECEAVPFCLYCANKDQTQASCVFVVNNTDQGTTTSCCPNKNDTKVKVCPNHKGQCGSNGAEPECIGCNATAPITCSFTNFHEHYFCCHTDAKCCGPECCKDSQVCCSGRCCPEGNTCSDGVCCPKGSSACGRYMCCPDDTDTCCPNSEYNEFTCCAKKAPCCPGSFSSYCCAVGTTACSYLNPANPNHRFCQCCASNQTCGSDGCT